MADPTITTPQSGEPEVKTTTPITTPITTPAAQVEEPFDKERAMETIKKLRAFEKIAKDQARQLAEYQAKEQKAQRASLSQVEQWKAQAAEAQAAHDQLAQEIATLKLRQAIEREAAKLGFVNPEDAYLLADVTGLEMDDAGKIEGVEDALKELLKTRPYLAKSENQTRTVNINAGGAGKGNGTQDADARRKELLQRFPRIKN